METKEIKSKFKKYPEYKDSGVEWLGNIPKEWNAVRMNYLFKDISIKNKSGETLLSVTQDQGVIPREWVENRVVMPSGNLESFKFIRKGDFAISLRSFEGGLEYCHHDGIISPAYTVLKKNDELFEGYYKYLFKSFSFIQELQTCIVGIREGKNISYSILSYSHLPIPGFIEQTAIANFLDEKTKKIDQVISAKEKLISLLQERKQIVIQNAVTRGLNPNVKLKDSGVEWIGMIPEHWEVMKVTHLYNQIGSGTTPTAGNLKYYDGKINFLQTGDLNDGNIFKTKKTLKEKALKDFSSLKLYSVNSLVMAMYGATIGKLGILKVETVTNQACCVLSNSNKVLSQYMFYVLRAFREKIISFGYGGGQPNISQDLIKSLRFPIPLNVSEQELIIKSLDKKLNKIDKIISLQQSLITKLKEYKQTLIDSAVTGKIKIN